MLDMKYITTVGIMMILLFPSIVFYSPEVEITQDMTEENIEGSRSGPQTYQDEMGGWWLQDEDEDFDGGEFEDTIIENGRIHLGLINGPPYLGKWQMIVTQPSPPPRYCHSLSCDRINNEVVLLGGQYYDGHSHHKRGDSWVFNCNTNTWTEIMGDKPPARSHTGVAYDNHTEKVYIFGGYVGYKDDTWAFDGSTNTWDEITTNGKPTGRAYCSMAYDSDERRIVLFGGKSSSSWFSDTWIFNPATSSWSNANTEGPTARESHAMTYDPSVGKIIMFGGHDKNYNYFGDTWGFDIDTNQWTLLASSGPSNRDLHTLTYDEKLGMVILFGGAKKVDGSGVELNDTWAFDSSTNTWFQIQYTSSSPGPRVGAKITYESQDNRTILFGGALNSVYLQDTWALKTATFCREGTYTSPIITIPDSGSWDRLVLTTSEPDDTEISVSLLNANTGLYLDDYQEMKTKNIDISKVTIQALQLRCHLKGDGFQIPMLESWNVSWTKEALPPEYLGGIPSTINIIEDTPRNNIINLSNFFRQGRSNSLTYEIEYISNSEDIHIVENESHLDVTYLKDNWTGKVDVIVKCSNAFGQAASSDLFSVVVQGVDDAPVWSSEALPISIEEDGTYISDFSYTDYLIDAENDILSLSARSNVPNITVQMSPEGYLSIIPEKDFFGVAIISITAKEISNPILEAITTIELTINGVNDDPTIKLLSPGDKAVYNDTTITLSWEAKDIDTSIKDITFGLYYGESKSPVLHTSDMTESSIDLDSLSDKTTYYWYIIANDGEGGEVTSPTWSFNIDTESKVIPGDTETDSGDLNVTIKVDVAKVVVEQGHETSFDVEIANDGEKPVTLTIVTSGDTAPCLSLNNFITLSPSEKKTEAVKVTRTALMDPGNYTISLVFVSPDGMKYISVPLLIQENRSTNDEPLDGDDDDKPGDLTQTKIVEKGNDYSWLFLVFGFLFLVILFLAVMGMMTNSKLRSRVNELEMSVEKQEVLEADAYVPKKKSFQHEIEDRTQIPIAPGPYQPQELPGKPFEPRVATFQSHPTSVPQLPTSQPIPVSDVPAVPTKPLTKLDLAGISGTTPTTLSSEPPNQQVHDSLQTPIGPFVQLPQTGGTTPQEEQKLLPENTTQASPPPPA